MLALLAGLLASCHSMDMSRAAKKAGVNEITRDPLPVVGTFENRATEKFGPKVVRLWEMAFGKEWVYSMPKAMAGASMFEDWVRIRQLGPQLLELSLIANGKVRSTTKVPCEIRRNHVLVHQDSSFNLLPLGYRTSSSDVAMTAAKDDDLVLLYRYEVSGIVMLIGSAGDQGTVAFRFRRVAE